MAAINGIVGTSIAVGKEYSGWIYWKDGACSYTEPERGGADHSTANPVPKPPDGSDIIGVYHTHGKKDKHYKNEVFSDMDKDIFDRRNQKLYVGTPGAVVKKYSPIKGKCRGGVVETIGQIGIVGVQK